MNSLFYVPFFLVIILFSCATFYDVNYEFNRNFEVGQLEEAEKVLEKNKREEHSKARFLYYANRGVVAHLLGKYEESNQWLEQAYLYGEDYRKNYLDFAASYFFNPSIIAYPGESHEHLMLLYYKTLNYLQLDDYDAALVECRRLNNRLYALSDKYDSENKFQRDAFIHNLMGIVYEASGDYNNAFIAYRNAHKTYHKDYQRMFNLSSPEQLKKDLLRTAYQAGFYEELTEYEKEFGYEYERGNPPDGGYLLFLWHNGLSPIKDEWSLSFVTIPGEEGVVIFQNEEFGFNFPFYYTQDNDDNVSITDMSGTRIAFPKYVEREQYFNFGELRVHEQHYTLEKAQDINAIAIKVLRQRMIQELGNGLLRVAIKKAIEKRVRKEHEGLGFLVSALNFASEQADTRNWQTLPHSIYYTRVPLKEGDNIVEIFMDGPYSESSETFIFKGKQGKVQFHSYQSLESGVAF